MKKSLFYYLLQLADNALILGHRISEWCGHGPILEQDIAITNTALDHLGQARNLYQYAANIYNQFSQEEKNGLLVSPAFSGKGIITEDDLAYLRDAWDFKNVLLVEQPNEDWAFTIARSFFYDTYAVNLYTQLQSSSDETIAAIAQKSLKEATYHRKWSSEWIIRLGDGTDESKIKMQNAINERWAFTGELYMPVDTETELLQKGIGADLNLLYHAWTPYVSDILEEATLNIPENNWMQHGGKTGIHSEHLGYILAEMQCMQRAYPGMEW